MVVGYEDNKYTELLGSYAHSDIRDIAIFLRKCRHLCKIFGTTQLKVKISYSRIGGMNYYKRK